MNLLAGGHTAMKTLESLESRRLMTSTLDTETSLLSILTTDADDTVVVWQPVPEIMRVEENGSVTDYESAHVKRIYIDVKGGNDLVILGRRTVDAQIYGGDGDDSLSAGRGNDSIYGGYGADYIFGGDGDDYLDGGSGGAALDAGDDIFGGAGIDTIDYSARTANLKICIGYIANDGEKDENDNLHVDIEIAHGGSGNDRMVNWGPGRVEFHGRGGDDQMIGGALDDVLDGGDGIDELDGAGGFDSYLAKDGHSDVIIAGNGLSDIQRDDIDQLRAD
jgi:Ca2+-binding RTX toxin-like protein